MNETIIAGIGKGVCWSEMMLKRLDHMAYTLVMKPAFVVVVIIILLRSM